jgi:hypothetical protein
MPSTAAKEPQDNPRKALTAEIVRLRCLDCKDLRARWRTAFRHDAPPHLSRHLLFRILAYELQAELFGCLAPEYGRVLDRPRALKASDVGTEKQTSRRTKIQKGAILAREWNGQMHRVAVLADGFTWNGRTYPSLTKAAFAITGTRWNGPRFFGLRDKKNSTLDAKT